MTRSTVSLEIDPSRCVLCGAPNHCAMARRREAGGPQNRDAPPCWCVTKTFPKPLLAEAKKIDNAEACICENCLAKNQEV